MNASQFINTDVAVSDGALFNVLIKNTETGNLIGPLSTIIQKNDGAGTGGQQYLEPKTIFTSGQAGGAFQILADFLPDLQRSVSALTLGIFRDVNAITVSGTGDAAVGHVFGFRSTSDANNPVKDTPPALTAKWVQDSAGKWSQDPNGKVLTIEQLMLASDPKSQSYNSEIAAIVNNQVFNKNYGASSFVSLLSYGPYGTQAASSFPVDALKANQIEQLRGSFSNPLSLITGEVASTISSWKNLDKVNQVIGKQLEDRRESISGVNLDEEAANLVKFQQMYGAASKVMQTANQMFNMLLNMLSE
jgi:flagellar hook-associated protein FlgK